LRRVLKWIVKKESGHVVWIYLVKERVQWLDLSKMVMNIQLS